MDGSYLAGFVLGAIVGATGASLIFALRRWRDTVASVPALRAAAFSRLLDFSIYALVACAAAWAALNRS